MIALTFATGAWAVSIAALFASSVTDLRERIIPNTIPLIIAGCGLALSLQGGPWRIGMNVAAAITVFLALGFLAHYGFIGGGDVKLISAVTLLVPPERVGPLLIEIAIAGGLLSCGYLAAGFVLTVFSRAKLQRQSSCNPELRNRAAHQCTEVGAGYPLPYALAVVGGVLIYILRELPQCFSAISCLL